MQQRNRNPAVPSAMNGSSFMMEGIRVKYLFLIATSLTIAAPALAQDDFDLDQDNEQAQVAGTRRVADEAITVVASGTAQHVS